MLAVPVSFRVRLPSGRKAAVASLARLIPARGWETRSCGPGGKGHRDYDWAWAGTASPRHWVLIRRKISDPAELAFFYCRAPASQPVSLPVLINAAGKRWPVEECHQQGKGQAGLDQHQVRLWPSFCRHTVLSMCAQALLAVAAARPAPAAADAPAAGEARQPAAWRDAGKLPISADDQPPGGDPGLVKVSAPEGRRLLRLATAPITHRRPRPRLRLVTMATPTPGPRPMASLPHPAQSSPRHLTQPAERMRYGPALIDGFLAQTGLTLEPEPP